ncbi:MAG: hypothetical protein HYV07_02420 [Deltaproteobacteria bacterium]|nr:hypothetical protein [Deltaproteobacteria bacterium]
MVALAAVPFAVACEEDTLNTTNGFKPADCVDSASICGSVGLRLDAGSTGGGGDAGGSTIPGGDTDAGSGASGVDGGSALDSGAVDSGPPLVFLDLTGQYDTSYAMEAPSLGDIADVTGFIYSLLTGVSTGNPLVDVLLAPILQSVVNVNAPWVVSLTGALNAVTSVLSDIRAYGVMRLSQDPPAGGTVRLHGQEQWNQLIILIVDRCVGRDPNNPPRCAEAVLNVSGRSGSPQVDLYTGETLSIEVNVHAFEGVLQPVTAASPHEADFALQNRDVDVDLTGILHIALDLIIDALTFYNPPHFRSLREMIVFGCNDISTQISNTAVRIAFLGACVNFVADGIDDLLRQVVVGTGYHFDQQGHAVDLAPYGHPDFLQDLAVARTIDGDFDIGLGSPSVRGRWSGRYLGP